MADRNYIEGSGDIRRRPTDRVVRPRRPAKGAVEAVTAVKDARGRWFDRVWRRDPETGVERLVEETGWDSNLVVTGMTTLLAGLLANEPTFNGGILFSAQGRGDPAFDVQLPNPGFNETKLRDEYFRKTPDSITFVDENGDPVVPGTLTNSILIRTQLDFSEANGPSGTGEFIREQGLYGGPAVNTTDSGLLMNLIFHKARFKDDTVKIERFIRLIF